MHCSDSQAQPDIRAWKIGPLKRLNLEEGVIPVTSALGLSGGMNNGPRSSGLPDHKVFSEGIQRIALVRDSDGGNAIQCNFKSAELQPFIAFIGELTRTVNFVRYLL
jgi:hypothetical protein